MSPLSPASPLGPTERTYLAVLAEARARGLVMTRTKVAKLLYLADLELTREKGRQATEIRWLLMNYGPFDASLFRIEESLGQEHLVTSFRPFTGSPEVHLELCEEVPELGEWLADTAAARVVRTVVGRWGALSASELRDLTYHTEPVARAKEEDAHGKELDLDLVLKPPPLGATEALERLRQGARDLPRQERDPGAMEGLVQDVEALRPARTRANQEMLG